MSIKLWMKPSYIKAEFLKATKKGWCYTKNNDEVIVAVPHLSNRLESQGLDPETGEHMSSPINNVLPLVSGIAKAGETLTSTNGEWTSKNDITFEFVWEYSVVANTWIPLSNSTNTLVLSESNVGQSIRFTVTAINESGDTTVSSVATSKVLTSIVNPSNTVAPVLSGSVKAGNTLTVTNGTWTGTAPITYTYKWEESTNGTTWTTLTGTTGTTLAITESHVGKRFRVEVTGTNAGSTAKVLSNSLGPVITALVPPSNTALPTVTGTAKAGNNLTTSDGTWAGSPTITYTYAWESSPNGTTWTPVAGQTTKTLALTEANVGLRYRSKVTATNTQGNVSVNSAATVAVVTALVAPSNTAVPVVTGTAKAGNTLTTTQGTWTGSPTITYANAWESSTNGTTWVAISGATSTTIALTESHVGLRIRSKITATNSQGNIVANSVATAVVVTALIAPSNTVAPVVSGTPEVGQTLSVTNGTWAGSPTINYTYNWKSSTDGATFTSIGNATNSYVITEGDVDKTFQVEVTGTNTVGNAKATSNNIGPVTSTEIPPEE